MIRPAVESPEADTARAPGSAPGGAWCVLALATLAVSPVAAGLVRVPLDGAGKRVLSLTLFDPLVWIAAAWLLAAWWRSGRLRAELADAARECWPGAAFVLLAAALSLTSADFARPQAKTLFLKSLVQYAEYLVLGVVVFRTLLGDARWRGRAVGVFCLAGAATVLSVHLMPCVAGQPATHHGVGGWLGNRNAYSLFLVFWLPVLVRAARLHGAGERAGGALFRPADAAVAVGVFLGLAGAYAGGPVAGAMLAVLIAAVGPGLSPEGSGAAGAGALVAVAFLVLGGTAGLGAWRGALVDSVQVYVHHRDPDTGAVSREHTYRYYRWSANLELVRAHPRRGVGLGQYEKRIGAFYSGVPRPEGRTDRPATYNVKTSEPATFGWYFVTAAELGLAGLLALALLLVHALRGGVKRIAAGAWGGWAVVGALAGLAFAGWWTDAMTRGCGGALAFVLALAWSRGGGGRERGVEE